MNPSLSETKELVRQELVQWVQAGYTNISFSQHRASIRVNGHTVEIYNDPQMQGFVGSRTLWASQVLGVNASGQQLESMILTNPATQQQVNVAHVKAAAVANWQQAQQLAQQQAQQLAQQQAQAQQAAQQQAQQLAQQQAQQLAQQQAQAQQLAQYQQRLAQDRGQLTAGQQQLAQDQQQLAQDRGQLAQDQQQLAQDRGQLVQQQQQLAQDRQTVQPHLAQLQAVQGFLLSLSNMFAQFNIKQPGEHATIKKEDPSSSS